jgi:hypothetical protein
MSIVAKLQKMAISIETSGRINDLYFQLVLDVRKIVMLPYVARIIKIIDVMLRFYIGSLQCLYAM